MPARILTLMFLLFLCAPASAEMCEDCGEGGGGGGGGTTYVVPETTWVSGTWGDVNVRRPSQTFKSDLAWVSYRCRFAPAPSATWDEAGAFDCGSTQSAGSTTTFTPGWDLPDGQYTFQVRACKTYDGGVTKCDTTPAVRAVYVDTVAPTVQVGGLADGSWHTEPPTVTFSSPDGGWGYTCATSATAPLEDCGFGFTYADATPDGHHVLRVRNRDGAGNESAIRTINWTKDTTAPVVTLRGAQGTVTTPRPEVFWDVVDLDEDVTELCTITGPGFELSTDCDASRWGPDTDLPEGAYTFSLWVSDRMGHVTDGLTRQFTIDLPATDDPGTGGDVPDGGGPVAGGTSEPSTEGASTHTAGPSGPVASGPAGTVAAPLPPATAAAKKSAKKKRCRTVKRKVRGKTRKVRVCKKAKKRKRAAVARRRA